MGLGGFFFIGMIVEIIEFVVVVGVLEIIIVVMLCVFDCLVWIVLVVGEVFGDLFGVGLVCELWQCFFNVEFVGIGGDVMCSVGCQIWFDVSELVVMGLIEILCYLLCLLKLCGEFCMCVLDWWLDVFIGIDVLDFNLGVECWLKECGIIMVYYVSLLVWVWCEKWVEKIGVSVDLVFCLFLMELLIYVWYGIDVCFVGYLMVDDIQLQSDCDVVCMVLGLFVNVSVLVVLLGSCLGEIGKLGEVFFEVVWQVFECIFGLYVVVLVVNLVCCQLIQEQLLCLVLLVVYLYLFDGQVCEVMIVVDVVVLVFGIVILEIMLVKCLMVVGYWVVELIYCIVKVLGLIKVDCFVLFNILVGKDLVLELIQYDCVLDKLVVVILQWFDYLQCIVDLQGIYV